MYNINEILEATKPLSARKLSQLVLETKLRQIEAKKQNITEDAVKTVSYESLYEVMAQLTICHEVGMIHIMGNLAKLGYKPIEPVN